MLCCVVIFSGVLCLEMLCCGCVSCCYFVLYYFSILGSVVLLHESMKTSYFVTLCQEMLCCFVTLHGVTAALLDYVMHNYIILCFVIQCCFVVYNIM